MHTIITYYRRRRRHRNAERVMWVTPGVLFWFQNRSCSLTHTAAAATAVQKTLSSTLGIFTRRILYAAPRPNMHLTYV